LAGSVGVKHVVENPYDTLMNNITLMHHIVPLVKKYDKYILFTSTSEVYGQGPFQEDSMLHIGPPTNPRWGYASAKVATEFAIASSGCRYKILRLFNVTGSGQIGDFGMVLPRFIRAALTNDNINVYGTGAQRRSFCSVRDAVRAIRAVESLPGNDIFNIGSDIVTNAISILELAHHVKGLINTTSTVVCRPYDQVFVRDSGDIADRVPDLTKLLTLTDYRATESLDTIILEIAADQLGAFDQ
jgi:UDP-glucose 4-epimerase